jgi:DNA-directed RNA polymerase subunit D
MAIKLISKTAEEVKIVTSMNISLANAIRRSVGKIPVMAISETDIYKNDSALYDEVISHRLGLIPLKNQKLKPGQTVELKLSVKSKDGERIVLSGELGSEVVYPDMPIISIENGQEIKLVARANVGTGKEHSRYNPGILYYSHLPKIKISGEGEKQAELAELFPEVFEMMGEKLKVKDETACRLDSEDMKDYPGVTIDITEDLVLSIESWGQMEANNIFIEACKALKSELSIVSKAVK